MGGGIFASQGTKSRLDKVDKVFYVLVLGLEIREAADGRRFDRLPVLSGQFYLENFFRGVV